MRRLLVLLGVGLLAFAALLSTVTGVPSHPTTWLWIGSLTLAGTLLFVAGLRDSLAVGSATVRWNVLVGVGQLLLALSTFVTTVDDVLIGGSISPVGIVAGVVGAAILAFFGVDYVRGGVYMRLPTAE
ncbi:hypothetical protein SAMN04487948_101620 [Halogranum amylolyticum]|uniref:Uncharacterized protein n=1 Tax=Halogranum amylolyticum TaxID=660520 RepID=A0A1H8NKI6_9EURY|nr:hypothetical protein [Halogranum amylolyticum]SEO30130.1 hypothetical protein SAMN04487948_101620 [Halogranum amylolyticum]